MIGRREVPSATKHAETHSGRPVAQQSLIALPARCFASIGPILAL